jgi:hypothetical protein
MAGSFPRDEVAMKKPSQEPPKPSRPVPGKSYEDQLPASVPDAHESNSESVWAMFQQSIINTEERVAIAAELAAAKAKDDAAAKANPSANPQPDAPERDSGFADTNFEITNFSELPYDATEPTPLKPGDQ